MISTNQAQPGCIGYCAEAFGHVATTVITIRRGRKSDTMPTGAVKPLEDAIVGVLNPQAGFIGPRPFNDIVSRIPSMQRLDTGALQLDEPDVGRDVELACIKCDAREAKMSVVRKRRDAPDDFRRRQRLGDRAALISRLTAARQYDGNKTRYAEA